jgi:hypothetical protein
MNRRTQQNEQESESQLRPKLAHPDLQIPNPFCERRPFEPENRAAAVTTILRPVNRRGPASPLSDKYSVQLKFDFENSSSSSRA